MRVLNIPTWTARASSHLFYPNGPILLPCRPKLTTKRRRESAGVAGEAIKQGQP